MDGALVLITLLSLGTTGAVLLYVARLIREDRARSNARVAALAEEIGRVPDRVGTADAAGANLQPRPARSPSRSIDDTRPPVVRAPAARRASVRDEAAAGRAETRATRTIEPAASVDEPAVRAATLFESAAPGEPSSTRWLIPVIGAVVVALSLGTIYVVSGPSEKGTQATRAAAPAGDRALELVSLRHARKGDLLTVSGIVRNPPASVERKQVAAVVFLFDRNGSFVASGRSPIDYQALAPGDESPFVITVPAKGDVSRYRVSFRAGDDVLPHVDRRQSADAAATVAGTH